LVNDGRPLITTETKIDDLPVAVPMIDINTVGAGGGSIAHFDGHAMLHVGPESAGSDPGPACYGRGGLRPTVTDANVVRGLIRPESFAGGSFSLDASASTTVIGELAEALKLSGAVAAESVTRIAE